MDFDNLCTPMRGQPEMTPPEALTLPGATAAYIAKLEAQVEALKGKLSIETRALELASEGYSLIGECDRAKARVAELETELAGWRDGVFVHPDTQETIRRLADDLASYKAAFIDLGIEMRSFGFVDCWHDGAQESDADLPTAADVRGILKPTEGRVIQPNPRRDLVNRAIDEAQKRGSFYANINPQEPCGVQPPDMLPIRAFSAPALMSGPYMGDE